MVEISRLYAKTLTEKKSKSALQIQRKKSSQSLKSPADRILFLQRTIGNQAVQRLIKSGTLQAKLRIGQPGDKYEHEADRVADAVMQMPEPGVQRHVEPEEEEEEILQTKPLAGQITPLVQRQIEPEEEEEEEEELQAKATSGHISEANPNLESDIHSLKGGGQPLSENDRAFFEQHFGRDFSQVRVHTDAKAAESARVVNAQAFTVGKDVVFGAGEYAPESSMGQRLMAHELAHVMQQDPGIKNNTDIRESCNDHLSRQEAKEKPKKDEDEKTKVITDGAGLIWDNLQSQNPAFKKLVLDKVELFAERKWDQLPATDKLVLGGWGIGTVGMTGAVLLSNENGRKLLEDINLATPFKIIPYMPLKEFKYKKAEASTRYAYEFKIVLTGEKIMDKLREKDPDIFPLGVDVEMLWGFNPGTRDLRLTGGTIKISLFKGLGISAGTFTTLRQFPEYNLVPGGGTMITKQRYPAPEPIKTPRGVEVMLTLDLVKMDWSSFSHKTREFFRSF